MKSVLLIFSSGKRSMLHKFHAEIEQEHGARSRIENIFYGLHEFFVIYIRDSVSEYPAGIFKQASSPDKLASSGN